MVTFIIIRIVEPPWKVPMNPAPISKVRIAPAPHIGKIA
jgi:hypothetical protein